MHVVAGAGAAVVAGAGVVPGSGIAEPRLARDAAGVKVAAGTGIAAGAEVAAGAEIAAGTGVDTGAGGGLAAGRAASSKLARRAKNASGKDIPTRMFLFLLVLDLLVKSAVIVILKQAAKAVCFWLFRFEFCERAAETPTSLTTWLTTLRQ